jgi:ubiquinone/menaquinone biosynthesis C-methylase UbiE
MNRDNQELPSTYIVLDRQSKEELRRLILQDHLITQAMGGVLPEQDDPKRFHRILDVGCGPGGWCIEVAKHYPQMQVFGIDISQKMINYAKEQAIAHGVADRVEFAVMDALLYLEYPRDFFDLINLRFGISFVRMWEWSKILTEMHRICKEKGMMRITETSLVHQSTSPYLIKWQQKCLTALQFAGYLPDGNPLGIIPQLDLLLERHGIRLVHTKPYHLEFDAGTPECAVYTQDVFHAMQTLRPFLHRWIRLGDDYDEVCKQTQKEMQQPDFQATWQLLTAWGERSW